MTIHKEGYKTILITATTLLVFNVLVGTISTSETLSTIINLISLGVFMIVVNFFRSPNRVGFSHPDAIIAPADGKVVVIEEVYEGEYLKEKCLQVSIFMNPFNVHINWYAINGIVRFSKHHEGEFMKAYLPKSSTENERTTVVIEHKSGVKILARQVAGAMARRIVCYAKEGMVVTQPEQMGFIKFGSRVDLYLPLGTKLDVTLGQKTVGKTTVIGWLK